MAEKRMFAKTIIDSDLFLEMPISARLLYYDLGMRADDDGFVNSPRKIMRMIGASNDDMNVLIARKYIIPFDSGVVVIKHWRINNYLRSDRYTETQYTDEKALLTVSDKGEYLTPGESETQVVGIPTGIPHGIPTVSTDKDRLVKVRKEKVSEDKGSKEKGSVRFIPPTVEEVEDFIFQEGLSIDAEEFFNYYASQKWQKANGRPLSDWQAAARYWERKRKDKPVQSKTAKELHGFYEMADEWGAERSGS